MSFVMKEEYINKDYPKLMEEMRQAFAGVDMLTIMKGEADITLRMAASAAMKSGALPQQDLPAFVVEVPADTKNGDFASNLAMASAKAFGMPSRKIAEALVSHMKFDATIEHAEVAGPGFINMFANKTWFGSVVMAAVLLGDDYGRTQIGKGEKVNVEFVSANPTGPMHLGNARGGALGDSLATALSWAGYDVTREFYINDAGNQVVKFGVSLAVRYLQLVNGQESIDFPEDGYHGDDIRRRAQEYLDAYGPKEALLPIAELEQKLVEFALPLNIDANKEALAKYLVDYDVWFYESDLHKNNAVQAAVDDLEKRGATYEKEGAIWYKATDQGAEKDEVLVRANGLSTYFAADIAYHKNKFERGFARTIDVWGADHHGHVARMKGVLDVLGLDGSRLDIVLMQFVQLVQDGQPVRMSKRTGKAIALDDLLDEVSLDSARFFFNMRDPGSQIEFDMSLAVTQDSQNPVYYVQYAHARICSILRALEADGVAFCPERAFGAPNAYASREEMELIRQIGSFSSEIINTARSYDPAHITRYVSETAALFHKFYTACRVKGEETNVLQSRLALCMATRTVLRNGLSILKVSAPERM